jgi:hypothetical protein
MLVQLMYPHRGSWSIRNPNEATIQTTDGLALRLFAGSRRSYSMKAPDESWHVLIYLFEISSPQEGPYNDVHVLSQAKTLQLSYRVPCQ